MWQSYQHLSCKDWRTHWLDSIGLHQRSTAVITRWNTWMCKHNKVGNLKILNNQLYMNNRLWSPLQELSPFWNFFFKCTKKIEAEYLVNKQIAPIPFESFKTYANALDKPCFLCWVCALLASLLFNQSISFMSKANCSFYKHSNSDFDSIICY